MLTLLLPACDSGSSAAPAKSAEAAESEPRPAEASPQAPKAVAAPQFSLPDGAEADAKAISDKFSSDDGFDLEEPAKHRDGLLWIAANDERPAAIAAALTALGDISPENYDPLPTKVAIGRLMHDNEDVFEAAALVIGEALWFEDVDPLAVAALQGVLEGEMDIPRKVTATGGISSCHRDEQALLDLLDSAMKAKAPEVAAAALSKVRRRLQDDGLRSKAQALIEARLEDDDPNVVAEAVEAYAQLAEPGDTDARAKVEPLLKSPHPIVRAYALVAWARVAGKDAGEVLVAALEDTAETGERLKVRYPEGGGYTVGRHQLVKRVRDVLFTAASVADPTAKWGRLDRNDPESVSAFESELKAWAKAGA